MAGVGGADTGQSELLGASLPVLALDHLDLTSIILATIQSQPTRLSSTFFQLNSAPTTL
jgi:hypothetical protein